MFRCAALVGVVLIAQATSANAQDCISSSPQVLTVESWTAVKTDGSYTPTAKVTVTLQNQLDQGIRMIDGKIFFDDVLGRSIVNVSVNSDAKIPAHGTYTQTGNYQSFGGDIERLPTIDHSDASVYVCVKALVKEDGVVVRFDE